MAYKDSPLYQARHRPGNFDLTPEPPRPPVAPHKAPPPQPTVVKAAPESAITKQARSPTRRKLYTRTQAATAHSIGSGFVGVAPEVPPTDTPVLNDPETYVHPDDKLTGLQREMLQALEAQKSEIGADILVEAQSVVRRIITKITIMPTNDEKKIFHAIGIPGF